MSICHPAFELVKETNISSLNICYQEFKHTKTGAQHIHLASDNDENVFLVSLRTVPSDSTGVAHILEHTALCGSKKYPVNDPFMSMTSRSLNTYMNAMTSSDWTAYPFASQNKKDFDNLLNVYLDAVFFATIDPLAFAQEGHRLEYTEANNSDSPLMFKGVVFNEMKGALSADSTLLNEAVTKALYPTVTYHHNSGGNPANITDLTYEQLKEFYRVHYHPTNATFITFGNISAIEHQERFEELALNKFDKLDVRIEVGKEQRFSEPKLAEAFYPVAADADIENKTYTTISWLLGESTDLVESTNAELVAQLLFGTSASPVRQALERSGFGSSLAPISGLNKYVREMSFTCGLSGTKTADAQNIEALVLKELTTIAEEGLPQEMIEACLHQFELNQRSMSGGGMPYGMGLALDLLNNSTHYGDPADALNVDGVLKDLQEKIKNPDYIKSLVKRYFLDNQHRLLHVLKPSTTLAAEKIQQEKDKLARIEQSLSEEDKLAIIDTAEQLKVRQSIKENKDILPKVTVADVPQTIKHKSAEFVEEDSVKLTTYKANTNGLVYQKLIMPIPKLSAEELPLLPLYTGLLSSLGMGDMDYIQTQILKSGILGQFSAHLNYTADKSDVDCIHGNLVFSVNGLAKNNKKMIKFLENTIEKARFDEGQRIRELISMIKMNIEARISQIGQQLAMTAAARNFSTKAYIEHSQSNLAAIQLVKKIEKEIATQEGLDAFTKQLTHIHACVKALPRQAVLITDNDLREQANDIQQCLPKAESNDSNIYELLPEYANTDAAFIMNTQVNFCAKAFPTVPMNHDDAAKLCVLGGILKNNFLHKTIREQGGAYGSGAMQDNQSGVFKFFSYRDPRLVDTLSDFDAAVEWVKNADITNEMLEESILGLVSNMDKPLSPSDEAYTAFSQDLNGFSLDFRKQYRQQLLSVTANDVKTVASRYLDASKARSAVITNAEQAESLTFEKYYI